MTVTDTDVGIEETVGLTQPPKPRGQGTSPEYKPYVKQRFKTRREAQNLLTTLLADADEKDDEGQDGWQHYQAEASSTGKGLYQDMYDLEDPVYKELHKDMWALVRLVNSSQWRFHLSGFYQPMRLSRYAIGQGDDWHIDYTKDDTTKLSVVVALDEGATGGDIGLLGENPPKLKIGEALLFPTYHATRVTEVTEGVRHVLYAWFGGPRYR